MHKTLLVAASLLAVMISGCATEDNSTQGTLVRKISLQFDDDIMDSFDEIEATFVYTHSGDPVNVADVTVEITEKDFGRVRDLSTYTSLTTLQAGDTVSFEGLPALAEVIIRGDSLLAQRSFTQHEWYVHEGEPIPLAGTGTAAWTWNFDYDLEFSADEFVEVEQGDNWKATTTYTGTYFDSLLKSSGTMELSANEGIQFQTTQTADLLLEAGANVNFTEEWNGEYDYEEYELGAEVDVAVDLELDATLGLAGEHIISATGDSTMTIDGSAIAEYDGTTFDLGDIIGEELPFEYTEDFSETYQVTPATGTEVAQIMQFYGTDLAVGDTVSFILGEQDDGVQYELIAAREQSATVGGASVDGIFLAGTVEFIAEGTSLGKVSFGALVTKSGLPIQASWGGDLDIPFDELIELMELTDDDLPTNFDWFANLQFDMILTSLEGDLQSAPWLFMVAPFLTA